MEGTTHIARLKDGDRILMLESCSHHVSCEDIGRVENTRSFAKANRTATEFRFRSGAGCYSASHHGLRLNHTMRRLHDHTAATSKPPPPRHRGRHTRKQLRHGTRLAPRHLPKSHHPIQANAVKPGLFIIPSRSLESLSHNLLGIKNHSKSMGVDMLDGTL